MAKAQAEIQDMFRRVVGLVQSSGFLPVPHVVKAFGRANTIVSPLHPLVETCKLLHEDAHLIAALAAEGCEGSYVHNLCTLEPEARALSALRRVLDCPEVSVHAITTVVSPLSLTAAAKAGFSSVLKELLTHAKTAKVFVPSRRTDRSARWPSHPGNAAFLNLFPKHTSPLIAACALPRGPESSARVADIVATLLAHPPFSVTMSALRGSDNEAVMACVERRHVAALKLMLDVDPSLATRKVIEAAVSQLDFMAVSALLAAQSRNKSRADTAEFAHFGTIARIIQRAQKFQDRLVYDDENVEFEEEKYEEEEDVHYFYGEVVIRTAEKLARACAVVNAFCTNTRVMQYQLSCDIRNTIVCLVKIDDMATALAALLTTPNLLPRDVRMVANEVVEYSIAHNAPRIARVLVSNADVLAVLLEDAQSLPQQSMTMTRVGVFEACFRARHENRNAARNVVLAVPGMAVMYDAYLRSAFALRVVYTKQLELDRATILQQQQHLLEKTEVDEAAFFAENQCSKLQAASILLKKLYAISNTLAIRKTKQDKLAAEIARTKQRDTTTTPQPLAAAETAAETAAEVVGHKRSRT